MAEIKTQAQLEELQSDPQKFQDHMKGLATEVLGDAVKTQLGAALEAQKVNAHESTRPAIFGDDNPKSKGFWGNKDAPTVGDNGEFRSVGEWLLKVAAIGNPRLQHLAQGISGETKQLAEGEGSTGGFLVPEEFRAELLMLALEGAVVRPRSTVIPMASETLTIPIIKDTTHASTVFGGVRAYWNAEAGDVSSDSSEPAFGQLKMTAHKLTGYTVTSNELLADSAIALEALLMRLFGLALPYFEDDSFINGDGAGEPEGILNSPALVTVAKETGQAATTIVSENLDKMWSRMLPSSKSRAVWLGHPDTFPQLASLSRSVGTGGSSVWISNMVGGPPSSIYGRPVIETEKAQTLGTKGDIYLADFSYYMIGDRQALTVDASPHVKFTTDEMVWRFIQRLDGRSWLRSALTPRNGSNTLSPFVALATRS